MSALTAWALSQAIPVRDKMVMVVLATHADHAGNSAPSMATLTAEASVCERSAQGAIKALVTAGLISVARGGGRSCTNIYHLETPQTTAETPSTNPAIPAETPQPVTNTPQDTTETPQTITSVSQIAGFSAKPDNASPSPPLPSPPTPPLTIPTTTPPKKPPPPVPQSAQPDLLPATPKLDPRGERLDPAWNPGEAGRAFAVKLGLNPTATFAVFQNFWLDKAGANARKVGWSRTWQNWCIKEANDRGTTPKAPTHAGPRKTTPTYGSPY